MNDDRASARTTPPAALDPGPPESIASLAADPARFDAQREALRRYCYSFLRNEDDAEDAVQMTLERALRYGTAVTDHGRWLVAIARNVCRDILAARSSGLPSAEPPAVEEWQSSTDLEHEVATRHLLVGALGSLTPTERRAVGASWVLDQTSYDAARSVGIAHQTLRVHLARARKKLAVYIDQAERATAGFLPWLLQAPHRAARRVAAGASRDAGWPDRLVALSAPALVIAMTIGTVAVVSSRGAGHSGASAAGHPAAPLTLPRAHDARAGGGTSAGAAAAPAAGLASNLTHGLQSALSPGRPQDAQIADVEPSPAYAQDRTLYASATDSACPSSAACGELFVSHDAGHTWANLRAFGLQPGAQLLLPPSSYGQGIFYAFGRAGLQVTTNGGRDFNTMIRDLPGFPGLMPAGQSTYITVANVDLWNFATAPVPGLLGTYLPGAVAAGSALAVNRVTGWVFLQPVLIAEGTQAQRLLECGSGGTCALGATLPWSSQDTKLVSGPDGRTILAVNANGLAVSRDAGMSFKTISLPAGLTPMDATVSAGRATQRLFVIATDANKSGGQGFFSDDYGLSWQRGSSAVPQGTVPELVREASGPTLVVALTKSAGTTLAGYRCSADGGATWSGC